MAVNYREVARRKAKKYGINPRYFERQINAESGFNPRAGSPKGARGIAQIMPGTARGWGVNPEDPIASLDAAAKNMAGYLRSYGGDWAKALAAYNAGPGAVKRYGGVPPYAETRNYIKKILVGGDPKAGGGGGGGSLSAAGIPVPTERKITEFDVKGFDSAKKMQRLSTFLARPDRNFLDEIGPKVKSPLGSASADSSPLFRAGVLSTEAPDPAQFTRTRVEVGEKLLKADPGGGGALPGVEAGGGYAGTQKLVEGTAVRIAKQMGVSASSLKRPTRSTATGGVSDHFEGNRVAYAADLDTAGNDSAQGFELAKRIAKAYGVKFRPHSYTSGGTIKVGKQRYRIQILYGSKIDHGDHVHVGVKRIS